MKFATASILGCACWMAVPLFASPESDPVAPKFSVQHMDRSVDPGKDFYRFATGKWVDNNPVPADKSRWSGFEELQEYNWKLVHHVLEGTLKGPPQPERTPARQVADFYRSALDTNRLEILRFRPIASDLRQVDGIRSVDRLFQTLASLHLRGIPGLFSLSAPPDAKQSTVYALYLSQGGLSLPSRDYYLEPKFSETRRAFEIHVSRMFQLLGKSRPTAEAWARAVVDLETELARVSKTQVELRDQLANYHKMTTSELVSRIPAIPWSQYLDGCGLGRVQELVVRQPEYLAGLGELIRIRSLADWRVYLRWHVLRSAAPYLHREAEQEAFAFNETIVRGQPQMEPRWQRAARTIDGSIGEALGQLFVKRYFQPEAKVRMEEMVRLIKEVFRDRLSRLEWMSKETRERGLAKFDRFSQKIGYPERFRDYSKVSIFEDDLLGNVRRASAFEIHRRLARIGQPVDRAEWGMTPQTVNAYFSPTMNEIVFPAGILQPPFFDLSADDAVNYGAIGVVIGHEITHGYDDQGRRFDADGNLHDWWTAEDERVFKQRAQKLVDQYAAYEALPGLKLNGELTLGENIADLGGASIAYEALQRALVQDPAKRKLVDGFTPEQRFFLSLTQLWRTNWREAELRRRVNVDPHSPGQFRAIGAHVNLEEFYQAFRIEPSSPLHRPPGIRAKIW